jgi:ribosome biogenesis protein YTM1
MPPYDDEERDHRVTASDDDNDVGEQIRVSLTLAVECTDRSLEVPSEVIAVPATIGRQGLSAVINHLLDRRIANEDGTDMEDDEEADDRLPALKFDFILGRNNKLLRTGVEKEARRSGISLEEAILVTYFPAQEAPDFSGESEPLPDWISAMTLVQSTSNLKLCTATYDGSIQVFEPNLEGGKENLRLTSVGSKSRAHVGPIKSLDAAMSQDETLWVATGSMDQSLAIHCMKVGTSKLQLFALCKEGHAAAVGSVDLAVRDKVLASGDWDGGVSLWDFSNSVDPIEHAQPLKKSKTGSTTSSKKEELPEKLLSPKISIQAHSSKVSGLSWGNFEKTQNSSLDRLITGSWDHSLKVWDMERQDCLLTLNGSRVVSCLDTSYHSSGIVATGHPDCTVRLWDVRIDATNESSLALSDNTFKPSHREWISSVRWSRRNAYTLASTSHDGTVKVWDIRSSIPLHTVQAFDKNHKSLCIAFGSLKDTNDFIFAGGTDCVVKEYCNG